MGGALGVAVFGSILASRLNYFLPRFLPPEILSSANRHSLTASPEQLHALPPPILHGVQEAFAHAIQAVFLIAIPVAALAFVLSWLLPEIELRSTVHIGHQHSGDAHDEEISGLPMG
jgi:hypothetical protein